jgi:hypothetical protein
MDKIVRDGNVAVIYSPGFGAGWSTWNQQYPEMVFDPVIVGYLESRELDKISTYVAMRYPEAYVGGLTDLTIEWVPLGSEFRIDEYDGNESIEIKDKINWFTA